MLKERILLTFCTFRYAFIHKMSNVYRKYPLINGREGRARSKELTVRFSHVVHNTFLMKLFR